MPPKIMLKKGKKKVIRRKKVGMGMVMPQPSLPKLPTGYNRDIPPLGGMGGSQNLLAALYSRPPPTQAPSMPIQTPDQFQIQRQLAETASVIQDVQAEQKEAKRRGRPTDEMIAETLGLTPAQVKAQRAANKTPTQPTTKVPLTTKVGDETIPLASIVNKMETDALSSNIRKMKKQATLGSPFIQDDNFTLSRVASAPPVIGTGDEFPGGAPMRQQGLNMAPAGKIRSAAASGAKSLVGITPIGDNEVLVPPPTDLQNQTF